MTSSQDNLFSLVASHLHRDTRRWPDNRGEYHADCPYCGKKAKPHQTHFTLNEQGQCYCQVCHKGTSLRLLAEHLGLSMEPSTNGVYPQTDYDYHDAQGTLVYQVVRYYRGSEKQFYQRRPDNKGGWIKKLDGVERVLYRLPEVLHGVAKGETVYIVEGEKDVETLRRYGLIATTNVGGAGKWRHAYNEALRNASVVILPDNDDTGRTHAEQVASSLQGIAGSVITLELPDLPEKGDVTDWLAAGHTIDELRDLVAMKRAAMGAAQLEGARYTAPQQGQSFQTYASGWQGKIINAAELQRARFPDLQWIVDSILPEGAVLLAGKPKTKKSWLALGVGVSVVLGEKALGKLDTIQGTVLYLDLESNQRRMRSRLRAMLGERAWPEQFHIANEWPRGTEGIAQLEAWMGIYPDTKLIVIDILENFRPPRNPKAAPYAEDYEAVKMLNAFAEKHRICVIIIHHTRKAKADDVFDEISGTMGLVGGVSTSWILTRAPDSTEQNILSLRGRDLLSDEPLSLAWDNYYCKHIIEGSAAEYAISSERRAVLDALDDDQTYQLKEIAALVKKSVTATTHLLNQLIDAGAVEKVGYGKYAKKVHKITPESTESTESFESTESTESESVSHFQLSDPREIGSESLHPLPERPNEQLSVLSVLSIETESDTESSDEELEF